MRFTLSQLKNSLVLSIGFLATAECACIPAHHKSLQRVQPSSTTDLDSSSFYAIESAARSILADAKSQISRMISSVNAEAVEQHKPSHKSSHKSHSSSKQSMAEAEEDSEAIITNLKFHQGEERSSELIHNLKFGEDKETQDAKDLVSSLTFARIAKNVDDSIHDLHFNLRK